MEKKKKKKKKRVSEKKAQVFDIEIKCGRKRISED